MAEPTVRFVAAVLTGGSSRRMGRDKATLPVEGIAMARRVADAAAGAGAQRVVVIGHPVEGLDHLDDEHPGEGPLGGVVTALRWADVDPVVVLACDLLRPSAPAVAHAVEVLAGVPSAAVAVPVVDGRAQWLHSAWRPPEALEPLAAAFAEGERSLHRAVSAVA
ncbi:MAG TPA: NTP transferase domain-containing protein, partial [Acidimicrobiales bacterium]|nr:NTP transferase domain-containing protein [Acidimicrobiales bacterium]